MTRSFLPLLASFALLSLCTFGQSTNTAPKHAMIDGTEYGWRPITSEDFTSVNCAPDTWTWKDGMIHCTGQPIGVIRTKKIMTNFELVIEWRFLVSGGNSGVFLWATPESIAALE